MFKKNGIYRHSCSNDLDILVKNVNYITSEHYKPKIEYIFKASKTKSGIIEDIKIKRDNEHDWEEIGKQIRGVLHIWER